MVAALGADHVGVVLDEGYDTWDAVDAADHGARSSPSSPPSTVVGLSLSIDADEIMRTVDTIGPAHRARRADHRHVVTRRGRGVAGSARAGATDVHGRRARQHRDRRRAAVRAGVRLPAARHRPPDDRCRRRDRCRARLVVERADRRGGRRRRSCSRAVSAPTTSWPRSRPSQPAGCRLGDEHEPRRRPPPQGPGEGRTVRRAWRGVVERHDLAEQLDDRRARAATVGPDDGARRDRLRAQFAHELHDGADSARVEQRDRLEVEHNARGAPPGGRPRRRAATAGAEHVDGAADRDDPDTVGAIDRPHEPRGLVGVGTGAAYPGRRPGDAETPAAYTRSPWPRPPNPSSPSRSTATPAARWSGSTVRSSSRPRRACGRPCSTSRRKAPTRSCSTSRRVVPRLGGHQPAHPGEEAAREQRLRPRAARPAGERATRARDQRRDGAVPIEP